MEETKKWLIVKKKPLSLTFLNSLLAILVWIIKRIILLFKSTEIFSLSLFHEYLIWFSSNDVHKKWVLPLFHYHQIYCMKYLHFNQWVSLDERGENCKWKKDVDGDWNKVWMWIYPHPLPKAFSRYRTITASSIFSIFSV